METLIIKSGKVLTSDGFRNTDLLIKDSVISDIGSFTEIDADRVIDATNLYVLPGMIDPQVHFREPGLTHKEDIYTGSLGAVAGGITSFFEMPNTNPATTTMELLNQKYEIASRTSLANYSFFLGASSDNIDQIKTLEGNCGLKIFMGSSTGDLLVEDDETLDKIFSVCPKIIAVHAEDENILRESAKFVTGDDFRMHMKARPVEAAVNATKRAISLALKHDKRLHVLHLSTAEEVDMIRKHKHTGLITAETTPQHLILSGPEVYNEIGAYGQMNPPIRESRHKEGLWEGLSDGTIDCIATDHAPHTIDEKSKGYGSAPSGMPGVETSLTLMLNEASKGKASIKDIVRWMSSNPADVYKIKGKGTISKGFDADLVLVDFDKKKTISNKNTYTKCGWSAFNGTKTRGWPVTTIVNGNIVFDHGVFFEDVKGKKIQFKS